MNKIAWIRGDKCICGEPNTYTEYCPGCGGRCQIDEDWEYNVEHLGEDFANSL